MIQYDWGPHYLVPSKALRNYSGCVVLREDFDEELLRKQMDLRGLSGCVARIRNLWFFRKKYAETWTKIGESCDISGNFRVKWNTTCLENGLYEILGFMIATINSITMDVFTLAHGEYEKWYKPIPVKRYSEKWIISEQNVAEVNIEN